MLEFRWELKLPRRIPFTRLVWGFYIVKLNEAADIHVMDDLSAAVADPRIRLLFCKLALVTFCGIHVMYMKHHSPATGKKWR